MCTQVLWLAAPIGRAEAANLLSCALRDGCQGPPLGKSRLLPHSRRHVAPTARHLHSSKSSSSMISSPEIFTSVLAGAVGGQAGSTAAKGTLFCCRRQQGV